MFASFAPDFHAASVYDIPPSFYVHQGIKHLLIDLDNTLDSYRVKTPSDRAFALIKGLKDHGLSVLIISNNHGPRVEAYATALGVPYSHSTRKPFAGKVLRLLRDYAYNPYATLLIGDQLLTDVRCARRAHIRVLLTEKIVAEDQWTTRFNRLIDTPIRRHLQKKGLLKEWTNDHE